LPDAVDAPAKLRLLHGEKRDRETEKKREVPNFIYKKAKQKAKIKRGKSIPESMRWWEKDSSVSGRCAALTFFRRVDERRFPKGYKKQKTKK
jgi:hypothetical protein